MDAGDFVFLMPVRLAWLSRNDTIICIDIESESFSSATTPLYRSIYGLMYDFCAV